MKKQAKFIIPQELIDDLNEEVERTNRWKPEIDELIMAYRGKVSLCKIQTLLEKHLNFKVARSTLQERIQTLERAG